MSFLFLLHQKENLFHFTNTKYVETGLVKTKEYTLKRKRTRMWANAQRVGRPAEYRWRPVLNAAKLGSRPLLDCRAVTLPVGERKAQSEFCTWQNNIPLQSNSRRKCI